jgi:ribose 1,5-bisphosphokinase
MKAGLLVLVVGPSGAGKDTLLAGAREALAGDARFRFVRRVITRPAEAGGEAHEAVSEQEFATRVFALSWRAHGLAYGIPADIREDVARGLVVVVNVSRSVIARAVERFPVRVLEVSAPAAALAARLTARGREGAEDTAERLARSVPIPPGVPVEPVLNDASPAEGIGRFVVALNHAAESDARGKTADRELQ